jgi:hypothetical protein
MKKIVRTNLEKLEIIANALVSDIIDVLKRGKSGYFYLPDEELGEGIYLFEDLSGLTLELELKMDETLPEPDVDGEYYNGEGTIKVDIIVNPNQKINELLESVVPELHELVTHEIVHYLQDESGLEFPKKIPKKPFKYYSQNHEIEAQIEGFKAKSKATKTEIRKVMKEWFQKYEHKHNLTPKEVNKLIKKLLENYGKND